MTELVAVSQPKHFWRNLSHATTGVRKCRSHFSKKTQTRGVCGGTKRKKEAAKGSPGCRPFPVAAQLLLFPFASVIRHELGESPAVGNRAGWGRGAAASGQRGWRWRPQQSPCSAPGWVSLCSEAAAAPDRGVQASGRGRNPSPAKIDCRFSLKGIDI